MTYSVSWHPEAMVASLVGAFKPTVFAVQAVAKEAAPVGETGQIRSGVLVQLLGEKDAIMRDTSDHAGPVIKGAKPHVIVPAAALALNTPYGPKASVNHPGNQGNPFLNRAAAALGALYARFASSALRF